MAFRENANRVPVVKEFHKDSRTRQEFKDECDINTILGRYRSMGFSPPVRLDAVYGDFASGLDYHSALNAVREAEERFMELPARVRARVDNDPGKFMDFVADEANLEELRELGLVEADAETGGARAEAGQAAPPVEAPAAQPPKEDQTTAS